MFHHYPQDRLRRGMAAYAMAENARLYRRYAGSDMSREVKSALTLSPATAAQIANAAGCAVGTARRHLASLVSSGVAVRTAAHFPTGGLLYLFALRPGVRG